MFTVELTSYGQSIVSSQVTIDGIILLYDYISDISSVSSIASYSLLLDTEACGNITKHIGCVKVCDHSAAQYQAKTILFYKKDGNSKSIIAGYSQNSQLLQKSSGPLSLFISFDFSAFTNGFLFASVQSGYNNAMQNLDGIIHIDDPNISSDDAYSVYSKTQIDNAGFLTSADMSNYVTTNTAQTISGEKTFTASDVNLSSGTNLSFIYSDDTAAELYTSSRSTTTTDGQPTSVPDISIDLGTHTNYTSISNDDNAYHKLHIGYTNSEIAYFGDSGLRMASGKNVYANSFIKSGGTSSQFLKADGSVDSSTYVTSSSISNYVTLNTTQTITGYKTFDRSTTFNDSIIITHQYDESDYTNYLDGASIYTELGNEFDMMSTSGFDFGTGCASNLVIDLGSDIDIDATVTDEHGNYIMRPDYDYSKLIIRSLNKDIAYFDYYGLHFRDSYDLDGGTCIYGTFDSLHDPSGGPQAPSHYLRYDHIHSTWEVDDYITATKFIKSGGTSSQFLKADGSVDSSTYVTSSSLSSNYVPTTRKVNNKALSSDITLTLDDVADGTTRKLPDTSNFVTLNTTQTVTGSKTFNSISFIPSGGVSDSKIVLDTYHYDNSGTDTDDGESCLRPTVDEYADLGDYNHKFNNIWAYNLHGTLDGNISGSATSLGTARYIDGSSFDGTSNIIHYGTCSTLENTAAKVVTISNYNVTNPPQTGSRVVVKFTNHNTATNPTLRVSSNGSNGTAKPLKYRGTSNVSNYDNYYRWQAGSVIEFVFDGTNWVWVGFQEYANYSRSSDYSYNAYTLLHEDDSGSIYGGYYSDSNNDLSVFYAAANFLPNDNGTYDLGKSDFSWNCLYTNSIELSPVKIEKAVRTVTHDGTDYDVADVNVNFNQEVENEDTFGRINFNFTCVQPNTDPQVDFTLHTVIDSHGIYPLNTTGHNISSAALSLLYPTLGTYDHQWNTVYAQTYTGNAFTKFIGTLGSSSQFCTAYVNDLHFNYNGTLSVRLYHPDNDTTTILYSTASIVPSSDYSYCLGNQSHKWDTVYAYNLGDADNPVTIYGNASYATSSGSSTTAEGLKKTVSSTDYTFSLNSSNYWVSNTNILPSTNSTSTSTGKDLGSSSYKWRYLYAYQLGTSSYKITNSYITNLYFGTANSNSSNTYTAALKLYNSDTTNYCNGVQCTGNLLPSSGDTYSLGSSTLNWKNLYVSGGSSSHYIVFDTSQSSEPTIRPDTDNWGYLGSSSYKWCGIYTRNINIYLLAISIQVPTSASVYTLNRGDTVTSSSSYVKYIADAGLHIYRTYYSVLGGYENGAYANGSYDSTTNISGTFRLLGKISCTNDNAYRTFIVPALQVV